MQTLQPLADVVGVPIETWDALGRHAGAAGAALDPRAPGVRRRVMCTHGEVLRPLLRTLRRRGAGRDGAHLDGRRLLAKGSAWLVTIEPDGTVSSFEHLAPALISTVGLLP